LTQLSRRKNFPIVTEEEEDMLRNLVDYFDSQMIIIAHK
jgi:hypothetical protein